MPPAIVAAVIVEKAWPYIGGGAAVTAAVAVLAGWFFGGGVVATILLGAVSGAIVTAAVAVMATFVPDAIRITSPSEGEKVASQQVVQGSMRCFAAVRGLQVLVFSRGGGWWLQAAPTVARRKWTAPCVFGQDAPAGTTYVVVALSGANIVQQKIDALPEGPGIIRSRQVTVTLGKSGG